jgi:REP element-mobilizing transposase RayT
MPDSYCFLAVHIVFSTKDRLRFLSSKTAPVMHRYIAGIIKNCEGHPIIINGTDDHIHILCLMPKEMSIAKLVLTIKANSSKWFKANHNSKFSWQRGYSAFAVSKSVLSKVETYIKGQQEHHKKTSFMDEFKQLLEKHGLAYSPTDMPPARG